MNTDDLKNFFASRGWLHMEEVLSQWLEDIRNNLEGVGPSVPTTIESMYHMRGAAEAIRNLLNMKYVLTETSIGENDNGDDDSSVDGDFAE